MKSLILFLCISWTAWPGLGRAEDWPTYQHDNRRSGVTSEELRFPLVHTWVYRSPSSPQTAWTSPAKWDAYSGNEGLQSMRNFDPVFFVTAAGNAIYFGSSVDNAAHCLDARTGEEIWVCFTNSAVRLPPTIDGERAWFGSDDGHAYCVSALTGETNWSYKPSPDPRLIPSDGKLISPWPVRTGVLVKEGIAYFAASLLPWEPSYLCAVVATTGNTGGAGSFVVEESGITLQGALLATSGSLYAPQGRSVPLVFERQSGRQVGGITGTGGVYCVLTEDEQFIAMPSNQKEKDDTIGIADANDRQLLVSFSGVTRMIASGRFVYFHQNDTLKAVDRVALTALQREINRLHDANRAREEAKKQASEADLAAKAAAWEVESRAAATEIAQLEKRKADCEIWTTSPEPHPFGLILAGQNLLVGGDGEVTAYEAQTGKRLWSTEVEGKAYGLAAANGRLFVSTDLGFIYAYESL